MASDYAFSEDEMIVDENVGFPRAYAKLCRARGSGPYSHGPPLTFMPYSVQEHEAMRPRDLDHLFPIIDPKAKRTANPRIFVSLLWKQLSHLGNAGFDPAVIRVDPYGNVLYYHADSSSPLAWEIDHWFPCSRGGLTVPSNLRILQWQASKKKHNKLEILIPWWDFQLGISVNQFMSIFASSNSDFRHRAFAFLFADGENEELNSGQTVDSHSFPQHFVESKEKQGLAPAAIVASRREFHGSSSSSILQSVDHNRLRSRSPAIGGGRLSSSKENENPYQAIVMARDSFRQRDEAVKLKTEVLRLDEEVSEMRRTNEEEKLSIQELEMALIKRRRRAEKCRRLAEAQSSYKTMLEKMIRDAMHQSVVYKEQVRLNQAASSALVARLEAQKAICDSSEKDLYKKYMKRDELEKQIRPELDQGRKRSRMEDDDGIGTLVDLEEDEQEQKTILYLPSTNRSRTPLHKELRVFLEEEQKGSDAGDDERRRSLIKKSENNFSIDKRCKDRGKGKAIVVSEDEKVIKQINELVEETLPEEEKEQKIRIPIRRMSEKEEKEEDEEKRTERGKGNVEKWLQMLLEKSDQEEYFYDSKLENQAAVTCAYKSDDIIKKVNLKYSQKEEAKNNSSEAPREEVDGNGNNKIKVVEERRHQSVGKERKVARCESSRVLRRIPSSPMIILGMKKGADCIRNKPMVNSDGDDDYESAHVTPNNSFLRSSLRNIKKAVKM